MTDSPTKHVVTVHVVLPQRRKMKQGLLRPRQTNRASYIAYSGGGLDPHGRVGRVGDLIIDLI